MTSNKTRNDEVYEQGVRDGQRADLLDQAIHSTVKNFSLPANARETDIYNAGYAYGVAHRPTPTPPPTQTRRETGTAYASDSGSASDGDSALGMLLTPFVLCGGIAGFLHGFKTGGIGAACLWGFGGAITGALVGYAALVVIAAALGLGLLILCFKLLFWLLSFLF